MGTRWLNRYVEVRNGAYLPHWTVSGGIYATCFRLADSLPQSVLNAWRQEREGLLARISEATPEFTATERMRIGQLFSDRVEQYLDAGYGACWLRRPDIAGIAAGALQHFANERYRLLAWCVMPNHIHAIMQPLGTHTLSSVMKSWKGFIANKANRALERQDDFWQPEYYDHLIRDEEDLERQIDYVLNNPQRAGLRDWQWVGPK